MQILRNKHHVVDPLWHVQVVLVVAVITQLLLPNHLIAFPKLLLPSLTVVCMVCLQVVTPKKATFSSRLRRVVALALIGLIAVANISSLQLLIRAMLKANSAQAGQLLLSAVAIYVTNIIVFGLLYWEIDDGGPGSRRTDEVVGRDFLFPQQNLGYKLPHAWYPTFFDYLYVSVTNATAFSPTDTMPLSRRMKFIMGLQALVSLITVAIVAARAINIL